MLLALDIGSSSVKAAILRDTKPIGAIARILYPTHFDGPRVEVDSVELLRAVKSAIARLGKRVKSIDAVAFSVMSPAWVVMDKRGKPLTPIVTHQDRRSVTEAIELEGRLGKRRHLLLSGNRPVPGGISSTTWSWFRKHHPEILRRADLVGHLNTFLIRTLTDERVIDPSNASFTGVYSTLTQSGWNDELCRNVHVPKHLLPNILESNQIAGKVTRAAATDFGLPIGLPALAGMVDTSAAMLLTDARPGQLLNSTGSTDVLALCTTHPNPHDRLITRALGVGRLWMSVSTLAAAGSAVAWAHDELFPDLIWPTFNRLLRTISAAEPTTVKFAPYLAGDRMSVEQPQASFTNLTLATTRRHLLKAIVDSLAEASAARIALLAGRGTPMFKRVVTTGGAANPIFYRDWPGKWSFEHERDATLRGLGRLV